MSTSRIATLLLLTTRLIVSVTSLQVTPNSPCSSICIDSSDLDTSDPNSSNTRGSDVVCTDGQFNSQTKGVKFKNCLGCLQNSTFEQGTESDQAWFLYNLRYAFDYCIFGFPNATGMGSNPCVTSEACGHLGTALEDGVKDASTVKRLGYCDVDGGVVTGQYADGCRQCVQADGQHAYLSNFFIALEAACIQKPPTSLIIGLNETIFTQHTIEMTKPSASTSPPSTHNTPLSTTALVGIVIGGVVFISLLCGCTFMHIRKRKNRLDRSRRTLSFRCKTAAAPQPPTPQPQYQDEDYDDDRFFTEKNPAHNIATAVSMSPVARSKPFAWNDAPSGEPAKQTQRQLNITTTIPAPRPAYTSPRAGGFSPEDYTPPTSTVSTRSNAPLLSRGYSTSPGMVSSPVFGRTSPAMSQVQFQRDAGAVRQDGGGGNGRDVSGRRRVTPGSPVSMRIQTKFDPPPTR